MKHVVIVESPTKCKSINKYLGNNYKVLAGRVNQIVLGKREITADTALRLGKYFGIEPQFWLNLQTNYNLSNSPYSKARIRRKKISAGLGD